MASGDTLFVLHADAHEPLGATAPQWVVVNFQGMLAFDASTQEEATYGTVMDRAYDGGDVILKYVWNCAGNGSGLNVRWGGRWESHPTTHDHDTDSFDVGVEATGGGGQQGLTRETEITFTSSQVDAIIGGQSLRYKAYRNPGHADDNMTGIDSRLTRIEAREA